MFLNIGIKLLCKKNDSHDIKSPYNISNKFDPMNNSVVPQER